MTECSGVPRAMTDFSFSVAVGQAWTQAPHETHSEPMKSVPPAEIVEAKPRPSMVRAKVPWVSSQARTQREQAMHLLASKVKIGVAFVLRRVEVVGAVIAVADLAQADRAGHVLQLAIAVG